jgi:hypothetical protein
MREGFEHAIHIRLNKNSFLHHPTHLAFVTQLEISLYLQAHSIPKAVRNIEQKSIQSQRATMERIKEMDPATDKTYEGGSVFLLEWYDTLCLQHTSENN